MERESKLSEAAPRLHVSLDVGDLSASTAFYGRLFGREPARREADWAKFELDEPPLVLAMQPGNPARAGQGGALNHFGLRYASRAALRAAMVRLELRGLRGVEEPGTSCCYSVQDKVWVEDPDGNSWELYTVLERLPGEGNAARSANATCCVPAAPGVR